MNLISSGPIKIKGLCMTDKQNKINETIGKIIKPINEDI